jgi:hypothetical protein
VLYLRHLTGSFYNSGMPTLMDRLKAEEEKLNREQEDSHGDNEKMKIVFQKNTAIQKIS